MEIDYPPGRVHCPLFPSSSTSFAFLPSYLLDELLLVVAFVVPLIHRICGRLLAAALDYSRELRFAATFVTNRFRGKGMKRSIGVDLVLESVFDRRILFFFHGVEV